MIRALLLTALLLALVLAPARASAENSKPQPTPIVGAIPPARDTPYPGTMTLDIDATDVTRGIFTVKEHLTIANGGHLVLLYPKWLPGNHSPTGQIEKLGGLKISSGGKPIDWRRDAST